VNIVDERTGKLVWRLGPRFEATTSGALCVSAYADLAAPLRGDD
jgi:hypothetical protein